MKPITKYDKLYEELDMLIHLDESWFVGFKKKTYFFHDLIEDV